MNWYALKILLVLFPLAVQAAADPVRRLPPSAFSKVLPAAIIQELEARGCTIPQTYVSNGSPNVIRGEFAKKGQTDWAVLCSRKGISSILVFWGGPVQCQSEISSAADRDMLVDIGSGRKGYSRAITVANKDYIQDRNQSYKNAQAPSVIDHDGINNHFGGKASIVFYCHRGEWLRLLGAD